MSIAGAADRTTGDLRARVAAQRQRERTRLLNPMGRRRSLRIAGIVVLGGALIVAVILSLALGARTIDIGSTVAAFAQFDAGNTDHLVVRDLRLPRTIAGIGVGIALAVAGALLQALTRNPLADPGLLGINAGASFFVVIAIWGLGISGLGNLVWFAFTGAGVVAVLVYLLGSVGRGGATPVRLALAGAALNALLMALVAAVLLLSQETFDVYRFWMVGSLAGADADAFVPLSLALVAGVALAAVAAGALNAVALGDDTARALGTRLNLARATTMLAVALLCGAAVAVAGPIGFVGLVVPHAARIWCGADQRWLLLYSALLGPVVLLLSDIAGRIVMPPGEVQVGIMTAVLGGPLFVAVVRRIRLAQL